MFIFSQLEDSELRHSPLPWSLQTVVEIKVIVRELSLVLCDDLERKDWCEWREASEEGIYVYVIADSLCYTAENNTILLSDYTPKKINCIIIHF